MSLRIGPTVNHITRVLGRLFSPLPNGALFRGCGVGRLLRSCIRPVLIAVAFGWFNYVKLRAALIKIPIHYLLGPINRFPVARYAAE